MDEKTIAALLADARAARENAYAPYSHFHVGAALLGESGCIYQGCNVENVSLGATVCAERNALGAAVAAGERKFRAICIAADADGTMPCGICRQALSEFSPDLTVICAHLGGYAACSLRELLPHAFDRF